MKIGARTPWGKADHVKEVVPGIWQVSTPGHGGYKLDREHNAKVHAAWRNAGGWYEEDCEWARVVLTFPELFAENDREQAHSTAKQYTPDEYTAVIGRPVTPAESRKLRERAFTATMADRYVATTAWGDWHPGVPKGFVGVYAVLGGSDLDGYRPRGTGKHYLVSVSRYEQRAEFGLVIDETVDQPWAGENATSRVAPVAIVEVPQ
ncbi:MAG TPA: hypothetical protein VGJ91_07655 [Polyangiaceae bacterium]|jgi:hypothetical protein